MLGEVRLFIDQGLIRELGTGMKGQVIVKGRKLVKCRVHSARVAP